MKSNKQKKNLHSYFLELEERNDSKVIDVMEPVMKEESVHSSTDDKIRQIGDGMQGKLDESMLLELDEIQKNDENLFIGCMNTQTHHVFFGSTKKEFHRKTPKIIRHKKSVTVNLRYPKTCFP